MVTSTELAYAQVQRLVPLELTFGPTRTFNFALAVIKPCRTYVRTIHGLFEQVYTKTGDFLAETVIEASAIEGLVGRVVDSNRHNEETFISKEGALELINFADEDTPETDTTLDI